MPRLRSEEMASSRYQTVPTYPNSADDHYQGHDEGPRNWCQRMCSSFPLVTLFGLLTVILALSLTLSLTLSREPAGIFIENRLFSATCTEHICKFGYTDYPRDIACTEDRSCAAYVNPCASNPCHAEGTERCLLGPKGVYLCQCKDQYAGRNCDKKLHVCDYDNPCFGGGTCIKDPADSERFSCRCNLGWMGTRCEFRSPFGDTCAKDEHCNGYGNCLDRGGRKTCHCLLGFHGHHCRETVHVEDCLRRPCGGKGQCIDMEDGWNCLCDFGYGGKQCGKLLGEEDDCDHYCQNSGTCQVDPVGVPTCKCKAGYGGNFCALHDVSSSRRYEGDSTCRSHAVHEVSLESLKGLWFLVALKNNAYNPRDACVQLSVGDDTEDVKNIMPRNNSLAVRYLAIRNNTSSHHKVEKDVVDEKETVIFAPSGTDGRNTTRILMVGSVARLYAYPLTRIATHDDKVVEFGVMYSTATYLVLHSCITDETHGHFDTLLLLATEKDDRGKLGDALQYLYRELPYLVDKIVMVEDGDCKD